MLLHRFVLSTALLALSGPALGVELPKARKVALQPLAAQVQRLVEALDFLGNPLRGADKAALSAAAKDQGGVEGIQSVLDKHCLAGVRIKAADKLEAIPGPARPELAEQ